MTFCEYHDLQRSAHNQIAIARRKGLLKRQPCEMCGNPKSQSHHEDYSKPLEITWLCDGCHKKRHRELKRINWCNIIYPGNKNYKKEYEKYLLSSARTL